MGLLEMFQKGKKHYEGNICQVVGIAGIRRGVGTTHLCVMAANYLSGYKRKKTAALEWNGHGDFERIERVCRGSSGEKESFSVLEVLYYKNAGQKQLADCLEAGIQYVIVDFGIYEESRRQDFALCGKRILVGSFTEWQEEEFLQILGRKDSWEKRWIYVSVFGSWQMKKEAGKKLRFPVLEIPYNSDAFTVTSDILPFFRKVFGD